MNDVCVCMYVCVCVSLQAYICVLMILLLSCPHAASRSCGDMRRLGGSAVQKTSAL
jgi:hypothetical protein